MRVLAFVGNVAVREIQDLGRDKCDSKHGLYKKIKTLLSILKTGTRV